MKTIKLFLLCLPACLFTLACSESGTSKAGKTENLSDPVDMGYLTTYQLNPQNLHDTFNKFYGKELVKHGHWINYSLTVQQGNPASTAPKSRLIKTEEGTYKYNKREGLWRTYNADGTMKDSVLYHNDSALVQHSGNNPFKPFLLLRLPLCLPGQKCG